MQLYQTTESGHRPTLGPSENPKGCFTERRRKTRSQRARSRRDKDKTKKQQRRSQQEGNVNAAIEPGSHGVPELVYVREAASPQSRGGYTASNQASPARQSSRPPSKLSVDSRQSEDAANKDGLLQFK